MKSLQRIQYENKGETISRENKSRRTPQEAKNEGVKI